MLQLLDIIFKILKKGAILLLFLSLFVAAFFFNVFFEVLGIVLILYITKGIW